MPQTEKENSGFDNPKATRIIPAMTPDQEVTLLKAAAVGEFHKKNIVSKTGLEAFIFYSREPQKTPSRRVRIIGPVEPSDFAGEIGSAKHRAVNAAVLAQMDGLSPDRIRGKIALSRGIKDYQKLSQLDLFSETVPRRLALSETVDEIIRIKDNLFSVFGDIKEYYPEITFIFPVKFQGKRKIGEFHIRCDAVIVGDKASGIVDFKTGRPFSQERILYNLTCLSCAWAVWDSATTKKHKWPTPREMTQWKEKVKKEKRLQEEEIQQSIWWLDEEEKEITTPVRADGKIIDRGLVLRSAKPLSGVNPTLNPSFAVIWPNEIVTNHTFNLQRPELLETVKRSTDRIPYLLLENRTDVEKARLKSPRLK